MLFSLSYLLFRFVSATSAVFLFDLSTVRNVAICSRFADNKAFNLRTCSCRSVTSALFSLTEATKENTKVKSNCTIKQKANSCRQRQRDILTLANVADIRLHSFDFRQFDRMFDGTSEMFYLVHRGFYVLRNFLRFAETLQVLDFNVGLKQSSAPDHFIVLLFLLGHNLWFFVVQYHPWGSFTVNGAYVMIELRELIGKIL